ncbi:hypothetical protein [Paenibacillus sp. R14(2021)]|uniref:hypothetical protein n=1 Tax=Paenibacillus sp. R14(2021) TaxID=2859228 RepID=UPI0021578C2E|nr:hypothetical protein [Paenibacillus sp. R14(2021)]
MLNEEVDVDYFRHLLEVKSDEAVDAVGLELQAAGFTPIRRFLDAFRLYLRNYEEHECRRAEVLLKRAMKALPEPGRFSPSWTYIWREFDGIVRTKEQVFRDIPAADRGGEWQVLLDNPFSNQNIAVYPGLTFLEAAYMFAYFGTELANNEYIRLQKIATVLTFSGADSSGLQPIAGL